MDRLTDRRSNGVIKRSDALGESVMRRLADYEDTGLSPDEVTSMIAENARLRAELEAAKGDIRALSDEYKFCNMCKYHNGEGVDTCSHPLRFSCDAENFYEWRGATENGGAQE